MDSHSSKLWQAAWRSHSVPVETSNKSRKPPGSTDKSIVLINPWPGATHEVGLRPQVKEANKGSYDENPSDCFNLCFGVCGLFR